MQAYKKITRNVFIDDVNDYCKRQNLNIYDEDTLIGIWLIESEVYKDTPRAFNPLTIVNCYLEYSLKDLIDEFLKDKYSKEEIKDMSDKDIEFIVNYTNMCVRVKHNLFLVGKF